MPKDQETQQALVNFEEALDHGEIGNIRKTYYQLIALGVDEKKIEMLVAKYQAAQHLAIATNKYQGRSRVKMPTCFPITD